MSVRVEVPLGQRSYSIVIGEGLLPELGAGIRAVVRGHKVLVVSNPTVRALYGDVLHGSLERAGVDAAWAEIPDGEEYKTLDTVASLYDAALDAGLDRASTFVALGGGVVGDTAGFAAATYMRGVPFLQIPTTLLAQVDSSVGGKVGVNHPRGKNIIGAFHQPCQVYADVQTLTTLPVREIRAGLAEVIKYGVIWDADFFTWLETNIGALLNLDRDALIYAIAASCRIKAEVVAADETEQGMRQILNYGHTFGHAVEALTGYARYRHGEAVAMGMVAAAAVAHRLGMLDNVSRARIENLIARAGLPTVLPEGFSGEEYVEAIGRDKKVRDGVLNFVLPSRIGEVRLRPISPVELLPVS